MSYFDEMRFLAENAGTAEQRDYAALEVSRMVQQLNEDLEYERESVNYLSSLLSKAFTNSTTVPPVVGSASSTPAPSLTGSVTLTGSPITVSANTIYGTSTGYTLSKVSPETSTAELPKVSFESITETGDRIIMTLSPERTISPYEVLQIMMMISAAKEVQHSFAPYFSPYLFVKKHSLERHFKFSS